MATPFYDVILRRLRFRRDRGYDPLLRKYVNGQPTAGEVTFDPLLGTVGVRPSAGGSPANAGYPWLDYDPHADAAADAGYGAPGARWRARWDTTANTADSWGWNEDDATPPGSGTSYSNWVRDTLQVAYWDIETNQWVYQSSFPHRIMARCQGIITTDWDDVRVADVVLTECIFAAYDSTTETMYWYASDPTNVESPDPKAYRLAQADEAQPPRGASYTWLDANGDPATFNLLVDP